MSRRHDVSDATGIVHEYLPLGRTQSWRDSSGTTPTDGVQGHAPGAIFQDLINGNFWINRGTFLVSKWVRLNSLFYTNVAASTAISNTTTETAFSSQYTIPANTLKVGSVVKIRYQGIATATHSTDTLQIKLYIGGLSGTALQTGTATNVGDNDAFWGEETIIVRTAGASGTFVASGALSLVPAATAVAVPVYVLTGSTAIDTTATQLVTASATWSVADTGNSCRMDMFTVEIIG